MKPFVSIIVPAFNEERYIEQCIRALQNQSYPKDRYEIIVVDNNSSDDTFQIAQRLGVNVLKKAKGPVGAVRNFGVENSHGDFIAFIDADCVASANWLKTGSDFLSKHQKSVFGGGYLLREHPNWVEKGWLLGDSQKNLPKDLLGGCIFVTKTAFLSVSGFSEKITSGEDTQLSEDLKRRGYSVRILPEISVVHLGNPQNIKDFFWRQVWHSENYIKNIKKSIKDPTFILTTIFALSLIAEIPLLATESKSTIVNSILLFIMPLIFSTKRIIRSKIKIPKPSLLLSIYILDFTYLLGRSYSTIRGIIKKISAAN